MTMETIPYLGSYDSEKRKFEGCQRFEQMVIFLKQQRSQKKKNPSHILPPVKPQGPLLNNLEMYKKMIENLETEALNYKSRHVNQNFRRINAECCRTQSKLDRLKVEDRELQLFRKQLIIRAEKAALTLGDKIHSIDKSSPCPECLKLA